MPRSREKSQASERAGRALLLEPGRNPTWSTMADAAIALGVEACDFLPAELHLELKAVLQAWTFYEEGNDAEAREALRAVGFQSPFLPWKLALRGLIAHAHHENERALENWSRLDPQSAAGRLIAPVRASFDAAFRAGFSASEQERLRKAADHLALEPIPHLRQLRQWLIRHPDELPDRFLQKMVPEWRNRFPELTRRLARWYQGIVVERDRLSGTRNYLRIFPPPPDDPHLNRLQALQCETLGQWTQAILHWKEFARELPDNPHWPAGDRDRLLGLIWNRIGFATLREESARPADAVRAFEQALQHAPELSEASTALIALHVRAKKPKWAMRVARQRLERDPHHLETQLLLAEMQRQAGNLQAALATLDAARSSHPLQGVVSRHWSRVVLALADEARLQRRWADARRWLEKAQQSQEKPNMLIQARWAMVMGQIEGLAAIEPRIEEWLQPPWDLVGSYALWVESTRAKAPKPLRDRFKTAFASSARMGPRLAPVLELIALRDQIRNEPTYPGKLSQLRSVDPPCARLIEAVPPASDLLQLCDCLKQHQDWKLLRKGIRVGKKAYPRHLRFDLFELHADLNDTPGNLSRWQLEGKIFRLTKKLQSLPPGPMLEELNRQLEEFVAQIERMMPLVAFDLDFEFP